MSTSSIRIDETLYKKATIFAQVYDRSVPKQIEHWAKIGQIMEENPDLPYEFVFQSLVAKAERDAGLLETYTFG
jgi:hypothetical protein